MSRLGDEKITLLINVNNYFKVQRANNLIQGSKTEMVQQICDDIDDFKAKSGADKIIVMWTANTERFCNVIPGIHDTKENLQQAIKDDNEEISPSTLFAYAAILKKVSNLLLHVFF